MKRIIVIVSLMAMSSLLHAALVARDLDGNLSNGHEGVYDDVLDITWLADMDIGRSKTFGVAGVLLSGQFQGGMDWDTANEYIIAMNAANYLGINNWRLPTLNPVNGVAFDKTFTYDGSTDSGYQLSAPDSAHKGTTASELAFHYYNNFEAPGACVGIGTTATNCTSSQDSALTNWQNPNLSLFQNINNHNYWTGIESSSAGAWDFSMGGGIQAHYSSKGNRYWRTWPVFDGDLGVVPIPATAWLFGSALLGLAGLKRKK